VEKWGTESGPRKKDFSTLKLQIIESELNIEFPEPYKYLLKRYSNYYYPRILEYISDNQINAFDLQEFIDFDEMVELTTTCEKAGMPIGFIAFALDCMGNLFCFQKKELQSDIHESKIYIFDHDYYVKITELSESFIDWIDSFKSI
jgi:hypothetical protein